jgi:hypothetical protein
MAFLHTAVADLGRAGDLLEAFLTRTVNAERGLQQPPLQFPTRIRDHLLPLSMIKTTGLACGPGDFLCFVTVSRWVCSA